MRSTNKTRKTSDQAAARKDSVQERLSTHGIYQSQDPKYYLRFYDDGTVLSVCSTGTPEQVWRWFAKENVEEKDLSAGTYTLQGADLTFSTVSSYGQIDYKGTINKESLHLSYRSRINGYQGKESYQFIDLSISELS